MGSLRAIAANDNRRGNKFDAPESPSAVTGTVLVEHPSLYTLHPSVVTACERNGTVQTSNSSALTGRITAAIELRPPALGASIHRFFELYLVGWKTPGTTSLNTNFG